MIDLLGESPYVTCSQCGQTVLFYRKICPHCRKKLKSIEGQANGILNITIDTLKAMDPITRQVQLQARKEWLEKQRKQDRLETLGEKLKKDRIMRKREIKHEIYE